MNKRILLVGLAIVVLSAVTSQAAVASSAEWEYLVEPYFLAPHMDGNAGLSGQTAEVSVGPEEVFDHLQMGAMLYFEGRSANWAGSVDFLYMNLGEDGVGPLGSLDVGLDQLGVTFAGYRRVSSLLELTASATFNYVDISLRGTGPLMLNAGDSEAWVDPNVGVRLGSRGDGKWNWTFLGTIGGFGIGSDFAWQAYPQVGFRATELLELRAAYRAIAMDFENGEGNEKFVYDLVTFGPQFGVRIHF